MLFHYENCNFDGGSVVKSEKMAETGFTEAFLMGNWVFYFLFPLQHIVMKDLRFPPCSYITLRCAAYAERM